MMKMRGKIFDDIDVDVIFIKNGACKDENFFYFTGLDGLWENAIAIVYPEKVEVLSPPLEKEGIFYHSRQELEKLLKEMLDGRKVGFNGEALSYNEINYLKKVVNAKLVNVSKELKKARLVKERDEIEKIRKACKIAVDVVNEIEFVDKTENEIAGEVEFMMKKKNAKPAFDTIVAFGKNTSIPHHMPTNKKFVMPSLIDLGAKYKSYCSDITRSFVYKMGKRVYEIVEEALYIAIDEICEGAVAKDVYKKIEEFFKKHSFSMLHGLGHSLGLKVHDGYAINKEARFIFKENMVFAIEPAIYTKRFGIRIEEDIIVKKNKAEVISR